jgi:hypothetical protein
MVILIILKMILNKYKKIENKNILWICPSTYGLMAIQIIQFHCRLVVHQRPSNYNCKLYKILMVLDRISNDN